MLLRRTVQSFVSLRQWSGCKDGAEPCLTAFHTLTAAEAPVDPAAAFPPHADVHPPTPSGGVPVEKQLLTQAGVVGVPNAGKSTLINSLVGSKVSAVSSKTNTTVRTRLGAFSDGVAQVVLYDTPGVVGLGHYKNPLHERRVRSAWTVAVDCDLLLFVIDAQRQLAKPDPRVVRVIAEYGSGKPPAGIAGTQWHPPPAVLVLNKVDALQRAQRPALLGLAKQLQALTAFKEIFWVSALKGHGVTELREYLLKRATPGEWTVDAGAATDVSEEELALEVVREKIFRSFYEEVPYQLELLPVSFKTLHDGSVRIEQDVVVANENVRKIIVGRGGAAIGTVGRSARLELEKIWQRPVHLFLNAKIAK